jgi:hypothetical protein
VDRHEHLVAASLDLDRRPARRGGADPGGDARVGLAAGGRTSADPGGLLLAGLGTHGREQPQRDKDHDAQGRKAQRELGGGLTTVETSAGRACQPPPWIGSGAGRHQNGRVSARRTTEEIISWVAELLTTA